MIPCIVLARMIDAALVKWLPNEFFLLKSHRYIPTNERSDVPMILLLL
jgi:hypothetical protein